MAAAATEIGLRLQGKKSVYQNHESRSLSRQQSFACMVPLTSQFKSSQPNLGRVVRSAISWHQKAPCVNYDYTIKLKLSVKLKLCTMIFRCE